MALLTLGLFILGYVVGATLAGIGPMAASIGGVFLGCMLALQFWRGGRG